MRGLLKVCVAVCVVAVLFLASLPAAQAHGGGAAFRGNFGQFRGGGYGGGVGQFLGNVGQLLGGGYGLGYRNDFLGFRAPVYVPAPVYAAPAPIYYAPQPVYAPAPVYAPQPVVDYRQELGVAGECTCNQQYRQQQYEDYGSAGYGVSAGVSAYGVAPVRRAILPVETYGLPVQGYAAPLPVRQVYGFSQGISGVQYALASHGRRRPLAAPAVVFVPGRSVQRSRQGGFFFPGRSVQRQRGPRGGGGVGFFIGGGY